MTTFNKARKINAVTLALALSAGTVGGMFGFAAFIEPAAAQAAAANNGPSGGNAGGPSGGETGGVMGSGPMTHATNNNPNRPRPRLVKINGFANCAAIQQVRGVEGSPADFYCVKSM